MNLIRVLSSLAKVHRCGHIPIHLTMFETVRILPSLNGYKNKMKTQKLTNIFKLVERRRPLCYTIAFSISSQAKTY